MPVSTRSSQSSLDIIEMAGDKNLLKILQTDIAAIKDDVREMTDLKVEIRELKELLTNRDGQISRLEARVESLEKNLSAALNKMDASDQYSRKDSIILSGPALPPFQADENTLDLVQELVKDHLDVELLPHDISITHRLGPIKSSTPNKRNIYVKLA